MPSLAIICDSGTPDGECLKLPTRGSALGAPDHSLMLRTVSRHGEPAMDCLRRSASAPARRCLRLQRIGPGDSHA